MSFKASVSLLIFSLDDLPIDESEVLKVPTFVTIIVLLFISSLMASVFALYIAMLLCWVHTYLQSLYHLLTLIPWSLFSVLLCLL